MNSRNRINIFKKHAELNRPLVFDGAMGSLLQQMGAPDDDALWTVKANIDNSKQVIKAHKAYIEAGSEIITTNTFRTNPIAVKNSNLDMSSEEFVKQSVDIALNAAGERDIIIAGSNPPAEDSYQEERSVKNHELVENHHRHIQALWKNGVDFVLNETQSHFDELEIIGEYCSQNNIPFMVSLFLTEELKILSGESFEAAVHLIMGYSPIAIGINCVYPDILIKLVEQYKLSNSWGFYLNCGSGNYTDKNIECGISPELYLEYVKKLIPYDPLFIGTCCGSNPDHIRYIRNYLDEINRN
jgi:methionine synthase I (cobalamin-dependent)